METQDMESMLTSNFDSRFTIFKVQCTFSILNLLEYENLYMQPQNSIPGTGQLDIKIFIYTNQLCLFLFQSYDWNIKTLIL